MRWASQAITAGVVFMLVTYAEGSLWAAGLAVVLLVIHGETRFWEGRAIETTKSYVVLSALAGRAVHFDTEEPMRTFGQIAVRELEREGRIVRDGEGRYRIAQGGSAS